MKKMIVTFGYSEHWAMDLRDAFALLDIFTRAVKVKQEGYKGPYFKDEDQSPPIDGAMIADLGEIVPAEKPDKYLIAARESAK